MSRFVQKLIIVTIVLAIAGSIFFGVFFPQHFSLTLPFLLLFSFIFALLTYRIQSAKMNHTFSGFARAHMVITLARLFIYSACVIVYLAIGGDKIVPFVSSIVVLYIVYTFLETRELTNRKEIKNRSAL